MIDRKAK